MDKRHFWEGIRVIGITVLIVALVIGGIWLLFRGVDIESGKGCERLGDRIGYNTSRFSGACHIEILPNLWVSEFDVAEFLPLIVGAGDYSSCVGVHCRFVGAVGGQACSSM